MVKDNVFFPEILLENLPEDGMADSAFRLIEGICRQNMVSILRADTDFPNTRMQTIWITNGYVNCGTVTFKGGPTLAYDKILKVGEGPCKEICLP